MSMDDAITLRRIANDLNAIADRIAAGSNTPEPVPEPIPPPIPPIITPDIPATNTIGVFHRTPSSVIFDPQKRAEQIKAFREYYSGQPWDVRGFTYSGTQQTGPALYARDDIDRFIADGGTGGWSPHFRHILGGRPSTGKSCGQARHGGTESVSYDQYGCNASLGDTSFHELMHNGLGNGTPSFQGTGLGHSHSLGWNGVDIDKMGDFSSLMGSGYAVGLLSAHICCLGWNKPEETIVIEQSQQVLIAPVEQIGLSSGLYKHVMVRVAGHPDVYLSLRLNEPYLCDRTAPPERLYVHELYPNGHPSIPGDFPNATIRLDDVMPGSVYTLPSGATVRYIGFSNGKAMVEVGINAA